MPQTSCSRKYLAAQFALPKLITLGAGIGFGPQGRTQLLTSRPTDLGEESHLFQPFRDIRSLTCRGFPDGGLEPLMPNDSCPSSQHARTLPTKDPREKCVDPPEVLHRRFGVGYGRGRACNQSLPRFRCLTFIFMVLPGNTVETC